MGLSLEARCTTYSTNPTMTDSDYDIPEQGELATNKAYSFKFVELENYKPPTTMMTANRAQTETGGWYHNSYKFYIQDMQMKEYWGAPAPHE